MPKNLFSGCEFHETRYTESHIILNVVKEFVSLLSQFIVRFGEIRFKESTRIVVERL